MIMFFVIQQGGERWRREIATLVIQLAWRQYQRKKLLRYSNKQKVLHEWTPRYVPLSLPTHFHHLLSVLAARQRELVQRVYGQELKVAQYQPPKPRPMVRPAYLSFVPSPAGRYNISSRSHDFLPFSSFIIQFCNPAISTNITYT